MTKHINLSSKFDKFKDHWSPKGITHKPFANEECKVMLIEPRGVLNTGDVKSNMTAPNDQWI